jgi:nitroreductase
MWYCWKKRARSTKQAEEGWSAMHETLKLIKRRRSIRQYKAEQVPEAELKEIMSAALLAPNARSMQAWHFSVIQQPYLLDRMVHVIRENLIVSGIEFLVERASTPGYNTFYGAPTVIMISADENSAFAQIDCGAAAENIALAATSMGLGSCVMTSPAFLFMSEEGNALREAIGIPDGYKYVCSVTIGYADGEHPETPDRNADVINYVR